MTKKNDEGSIRGSVRFADVVEADERRGDIAEAQPIPGSSAGHDDGVTGKDRRLSFVSRQYDIDGDGQLGVCERVCKTCAVSCNALIVLILTPTWRPCAVCPTINYVSVRNLDKSGRGFLTNEKVYALMTEQLAMQSKIFQFKKIIIG